MSDFYGANTQLMRQHADLMRRHAGAVDDLRSRLESMVLDESSWKGPDAEAFRDRWHGQVGPKLHDLRGRLDEKSSSLDREAEEQDQASESNDGGSGAGSQGHDGGGHSPLDMLKSLLHGPAKDAFDAVKKTVMGPLKVFNALKNMKDPEKLMEKLRGMKGKVFDKFLSKLGSFERLMAKAPWLMKAGKVAGKLLPGLDILTGGLQLVDSIRKGDVFHAVTGGVTTLGGVLVTAGTVCDMTGVGAVVGVPLQVAGTVLVGGAMAADGVKWLWDHKKEVGHVLGQVKDGAGHLLSEGADAVKDTVSSGVETVKDTVSDAVSGAKDKISGAFSGAKHMFGF